MGCIYSKRSRTNDEDVFKPSPASFLLFDISKIEEPWRTPTSAHDNSTQQSEKDFELKQQGNLPRPIFEKISKFEEGKEAPHSWIEISNALEKDFKLKQQPAVPVVITKKPDLKSIGNMRSVRTLDDFNEKLELKAPRPKPRRAKTELAVEEKHADLANDRGGIKRLKDNPFIVRDRMEKEKEGTKAAYDRMMNYKRNPLTEYPAKCPPQGEKSLVIYTTSLRGVRQTYDDCARVLSIFEGHHAVYDERDVALHGEFLVELKTLIGEIEGSGIGVPRVFINGRDLGGVEALVELNESGRLGRMLGFAGVERRVGWKKCDGCGGARFILCLSCHGSCGILNENGGKDQCESCNENGLVRCPACL